jgi:hypothetical protein
MLHANRFACTGVLAASALMAAACGSANDPAPGGPSHPASSSSASTQTSSPAATPGNSVADACSLITAGQASTALGQETGAGASSGSGGQCTYTASAGDLTVIATQYPDGSTAGSSFNGTRTAAMGGVPGFQDVSGIGDHAFLTSTGLIEFVKGSVVVIIQALGTGNPTAGMMTSLGQAAAGRL